MNNERLRYREEREIDLFDMFIEVLLHWRGLIVAMIIGGLVLGGYSLYGSYKANALARAAKAAAEEQAALNAENIKAEEEIIAEEEKALEEAASALTETQIANVDSVIIQQKQLQQAEKYAEKSVLMNVDYNEVPKADITFKIGADGDRSYDIAKAYEDILTSSEMFKYVAEKCGMGSEVSECIGLDNKKSSNSTNYATDTDVIGVYVYGANTESCEKIADAFCKYAFDKASELQLSLGEHVLSLVNKSVSTVYNKEIYDKQIANQNTIISLKKTIAAAVDAIKDEEKAYYELKTNAVLRENEEAEEETETKPEEIVVPKISVDKKKFAIGLGGGLFVYALIICIGYIFNGKVKDSDDFERLFGIKTIGKIYGAGDKRANKKGIDSAIYSLKRRGRKPIVQSSAEKMVAINSAALASKEETKNVAIISGDFDAAGLIERIKETITTEEKNAEIFESLLYSSTEAQELKNVDSAIIVIRAKKSRYNETEEMLKILENRGIKILGGVMA
ncbi:MAG: hypothetical protein IJ691_00730 [Lachnospiraceae bacterium]|nr:hypothetical protein [Lachnospiraceae bacterium]